MSLTAYKHIKYVVKTSLCRFNERRIKKMKLFICYNSNFSLNLEIACGYRFSNPKTKSFGDCVSSLSRLKVLKLLISEWNEIANYTASPLEVSGKCKLVL